MQDYSKANPLQKTRSMHNFLFQLKKLLRIPRLQQAANKMRLTCYY